MSFRALRNARKVRVGGPTAKAVYLTLCDAANDATLTCTLSVATIAARSETSTRTVRRVLTKLVADGLVVRTRLRYRDGRMGVYGFTLRLSPAANVSAIGSDQRPPETAERPPVTGTSGQSLAGQKAVVVQAAESSGAVIIQMPKPLRWTAEHEHDPTELDIIAQEQYGEPFAALNAVQRSKVRVAYLAGIRGLEAEQGGNR